MLDESIVGKEHYDVARAVQKILQDYKQLQDIIAILGMDELSEQDKLTVARARKVQRFMSQPFRVAEVFTGYAGKFVGIKETIAGFKKILAGEMDDVPETAFYMVGPIQEVIEKAAQIAKEVAEKKERDRLEALGGNRGTGQSSGSAELAGATPKQVEAYQALKKQEKESRQYFADHPEEDQCRKYLTETFGVKPIVLDIDNPTFPRQLLQGFEADLAAMEKSENEAYARRKAAAEKEAAAAASV